MNRKRDDTDVYGKLEEYERLLTITQQIGNVGSWVYDPASKQLAWSKQVFRIFGVDEDRFEVTYENHLQLVHPEDRRRVDEAYRNSNERGEPGGELQFRILRRRDGRVRHIYTKWLHQRDDAGNLLKVYGFVQDVTDRVWAEGKIRAEHARAIDILENMNDAFVSLDRNWCYTYMNAKAGRIFGRDPKEMIGKHIWTEFPEGVGQPFHLAYERAMKERVFISLEEYYPPYDRWFENRIYPTEEGIAIFFNDITERKKTEQALVQSEEKFRKAFHCSPDAVNLNRLEDGMYLDINEGFTRIMGFTRRDVIGKTSLELDIWVDPKDRQRLVNELKEKGSVSNLEAQFRAKSGEIKTGLMSASVLELDGERCILSITRDITEYKRLRDELERLNEQLELRVAERTMQLAESNRALEEFVYSVSHDLRAPLRAITGFAEILARRHRQRLDEEGRRYLDNILDASNNMAALISDLLAFSRLGKGARAPENIDTGEVVRDVLSELEDSGLTRGADVVVEPGLPAVRGSRTLLRQAIYNLVENALKYRRLDEGHRVEIRGRRKDGRAVIEVADNGIGIAPEHQQKVFDIFQRLHGQEKYKGTGIGLATVRKAARLMDGTVELESTPGQGSTFRLLLPAAGADAPPGGVSPAERNERKETERA